LSEWPIIHKKQNFSPLGKIKKQNQNKNIKFGKSYLPLGVFSGGRGIFLGIFSGEVFSTGLFSMEGGELFS
jgi:hypothetical protein